VRALNLSIILIWVGASILLFAAIKLCTHPLTSRLLGGYGDSEIRLNVGDGQVSIVEVQPWAAGSNAIIMFDLRQMIAFVILVALLSTYYVIWSRRRRNLHGFPVSRGINGAA
jgi:hypothetical protein